MTDMTAPLVEQGLALHRAGAIAEAARLYSQALNQDPRNVHALRYLAMILCQQGQFPKGIELLRRAIDVEPQNGAAHDLLGRALHGAGQLDAALASFDAAVSRQPDLANAHGSRGLVLHDLGRPEEAVASYDRAIELNPTSFEDWCNRGRALQALGREEEALASNDRAIALNPGVAEIHVNRGNMLSILDRFEEAVAAYDGAIALNPNLPLAYAQKGLALKNLSRIAEARTLVEKALAMEPNNAVTAFALAQILLLQGEWRQAWPLYERRAQMPTPPYQTLLSPRWNGEGPDHYRLVVVTEQGLGDAFHFGRYAALLAGRGHAVTVLTRPVLKPLLSTLPGVERVVTSADELARDPRPFRWIPLMSVPRALHLMPNAIPVQEPYVSVEPSRTAAWGARLGQQDLPGQQGLKVGIAWQGQTARRDRSAPLTALAPLAYIDHVRLISLQKQPGSAQIEEVPFADRIERPMDDADTSAEALLDTAAVITNLDLIVSVDTMAAHLAGALGRPAFIALRHVADWRWLTGRNDSPFYPNARLFRQETPGDWSAPFDKIADAVRALARSDG
jgi:tetratricopeptide (TPR) repeat protein